MADREALAQGRAAYDHRDWGQAYQGLREAAAQDVLAPQDLERLAVAAYLSGHREAALDTLERLHHVLMDVDLRGAVRWAAWLALLLALGGEQSRAGGWLSRAQRLAVATPQNCPERAYALVPVALQVLGSGDAQQAHALFQQVVAVAGRCDDADLAVMGVLGLGQALVAQGDAAHGVAALDEAMVVVTSGDVSPIMAGITYCAVINACRDVFDLRRAQEWTAALSRWCRAQRDLHPFRGQCLVHRAEILQLRGEWSEAMEEVERACAHLSSAPGDPVMGMARYQQAELLRLRGRLAGAERAYRQASERGRSPQPGLALLRLAQGRVDDAAFAIRREVEDAAGDRVRRSRLLAAEVEILLAAEDATAAGAAVAELEELAAGYDSVYLDAAAAQARGAVLLAAGEAAAACAALGRSWRAWQELDAPYDAARVRLLMAQACRQVGDDDTAELEADAARRVFEQLGAAPALSRALELSRRTATASSGVLTPREVEVLRLVATGATNREVADTLVISEKTVARHLSNMFVKLGVASRAAATAWAYEHRLA